MSHQLPDLPYDFGALEPYIDAKTMEIHHGRHHKAYVDKLNAALEQAGPEWQDKPLERLMVEMSRLPDNVRTAVRNNGGGHINHSLFWETMSPKGGGEPTGALRGAITSTFGAFDTFQEQFSNAALTRFGSGWAWLAVDDAGVLEVLSTPNQDNPWLLGKRPVLGLDVWEHAYYLHYQNRRPDYIAAWWNVVNWAKADEVFASAK